MPSYILAYYGGNSSMDPNEGAKERAKFGTWVSGLGSVIVNPGTPLGKITTVSSESVSDGVRDPLTGFSIIKAENLHEAVQIAKGCPFLKMGAIDVAEVMEMQR